jgi:hypothetical protein
MQKTLIIVGIVCLAIGVAWPWLSVIPLGKLPGDIVIEHEHFRFYFPITTLLIVSVILSLIIWILRN